MIGDFPPLPHVRLIGKVGHGGMSTVWKAMDLLRNEIVAVKVLNRELTSNAEDIRQFRDEADAMKNIDHIGIVKCHEINCIDGVWYYVMEYVGGYNFSELLMRKQYLKETDCLLICQSIAAALDYAWNKCGVVHCDIKPENIMITTDGVVKLTDLGLCHTYKYLKDGLQDVPDHVMGTPAYISPEQVFGDVEPDCRADIYSMGATLYHLSTGRLLFPDMDNECMLRAHCSDAMQAKDPRTYRPKLTYGFCQMLEAMLVKNREGRLDSWASIFEMCHDIELGYSFKTRETPDISSLSLRIE